MLLQHAISYANKQIFDAAQQDESCAGMGTTVVIMPSATTAIGFSFSAGMLQ